MEIYAHLDTGELFSSDRICDMSTAIAILYSPEGFALAADGRGTTESGIATETAQKIFPICEDGKKLAYCMAGHIGFISNDGRYVFDFRSETAKSLQETDTSGAKSLCEYVKLLCEPIEAKLRSVMDGENSSSYPTDAPCPEEPETYVIARIFFDGYYRGIPAQATAVFRHENRTLCKTFVASDLVLRDVLRGSGSPLISEKLRGNSGDWLDSYRVKLERPTWPTLAEATELVKGYVDACCDPRALELDKERCAFIGGHIHAATITKSEGFRWVIEPVNNCK